MIREQVPGHVSLVDEIADLLEISIDSAYRRIRGEKPLSLHELQILAGKYRISLDDLMGSPTNSVTFRTNFLQEDSFTFVEWLRDLLDFTLTASQAHEVEAIFILNELSIFHIVQIPEICAFKLFFWKKSNLDFPGFRELKFRVDDLDQEVIALSEQITEHYVRINTKEFTTEECLNSFLKQVLYYSEAGYFNSSEDVMVLCEKLQDLVDHLQMQAACGYKFPFGMVPSGVQGNFQLFHNDLILADNTILVKSDELCATYLTSNAINLMQTLDRAFFDYNYAWGRNLISKSVPISGTAEKERNRFFRALHEKIDHVKQQL